MTKQTILRKVQEFKKLLETKLTLEKVTLFGSYANKTSTEDSDIDILIELDHKVTAEENKFISECAWEIGFPDIHIKPLALSCEQIIGQLKYSPLIKKIQSEGLIV